ncbi:MAG TPA: tRNA (adenosine(37)-N6)-dimethylallyltransferase MiaA [Alphaproteobacteria bacterium]
MSKILIISGPTASGKSALAIALAKKINGIIINGDALQIYQELRILTARPDEADERQVPHALYGFHSILNPYAVTDWLRDIKPVIETAWRKGQMPIIVGGTGFYLHALLHGLAPVPDVPETIRAATMALYENLGHDAFRAQLRDIDPVLAETIKPNDRQRLVRAMEVYQATGQPLSFWQQQPRVTLFPDLQSHAILLDPPRDILYERINQRFEKMIQAGALTEAHEVEKLNPDPALPGCKALGLAPLRDYIKGKITLPEAIEIGQTTSRQYAKRQVTWLRTQWIESAAHKIIMLQDLDERIQEMALRKVINWIEKN